MSAARQKHTTYIVTLTPASGNWLSPPTQRLRLALKVLLRGFGLRAINVTPMVTEPKPDAKETAKP
jgi:hypothetical protein